MCSRSRRARDAKWLLLNLIHYLLARELVRFAYLRWIMLSMGITFQVISTSFFSLYPSLEAFLPIGIITQKEIDLIDKSEAKTEVPLQWCVELIRRKERQENRTLYHMRDVSFGF